MRTFDCIINASDIIFKKYKTFSVLPSRCRNTNGGSKVRGLAAERLQEDEEWRREDAAEGRMFPPFQVSQTFTRVSITR